MEGFRKEPTTGKTKEVMSLFFDVNSHSGQQRGPHNNGAHRALG